VSSGAPNTNITIGLDMEPKDYTSLTGLERRMLRYQYVVAQRERCYHCKAFLYEGSADTRDVNPKLFPKGFFDHPVHLHHDHETGMTIGAVHAHCNAVLWQYHGK